MIFKNYYKILGLNQNIKSTSDEIKSAYREQAKRYHPDVNKDAEERFKDINEAYRTLSDPLQRKKYDRLWYNYVGKKIQRENSNKTEVKINDIVNLFFGGNINKKKVQVEQKINGENIETEINISLNEAFYGISKKIELSSLDGKNKTINVNIPSGIPNGAKICLKGKGKDGKNGGNQGDLIIKINILNNDKFKIKGNDINTNAYITPWDAALGSKLKINGIDGEITILVPKGTQDGDKISIKNKGYNGNNNERGNLIVEIKIAIPKKLSDEERELFTKLKEISTFKPETGKHKINVDK